MSRNLTMRATMRLAADRLLKMLRDLIVIPSDGEPWIAREPRGRAEALARLLNDYRRELNADEYLWNACNQLAEECVAAKGKNTSPEQDGCLHLRDGSKPHAPILIYLLMAIEWLDAVDKDRPQEDASVVPQNQNPAIVPPMTPVSMEPKFVHDRLRSHYTTLEQDVEQLRRSWRVVDLKRWPIFKTVPKLDYLRSQLITYGMRDKSTGTDATPAAWHPYILDYCRRLGVPCDAVDRLYQRLVAGDVTEERAVELEAKQGLEQLRIAISRAHDQWLENVPVIRQPNPNGSNVHGEFSSFLAPKTWRLHFKKAGHAMSDRTWTNFANRLRGRNPPDLINDEGIGPKKVSIRLSILREMGIEPP